jgi:hypothetical protein
VKAIEGGTLDLRQAHAADQPAASHQVRRVSPAAPRLTGTPHLDRWRRQIAETFF